MTTSRLLVRNAVAGASQTDEGDGHTLPADTAVQKRNPEGQGSAAFLSWFVVDPASDFAPGAELGG